MNAGLVVSMLSAGFWANGIKAEIQFESYQSGSVWSVYRALPENDLFEGPRKTPSCEMTNKTGNTTVLWVSDGLENRLRFAFTPKNIGAVLLEHTDELSSAERFVKSSSSSWVAAGVRTH